MKITKNMTNLQISQLLEAVAAAYKLKDHDRNRFKIAAYERAAVAVEHLSSEAKDLWDEDKLEEVGGIGKSIAAHLDEIFRTGKSKHFDKLMKGIPPATFELMKVSGIGAKSAFKLTQELGIIEAKDAIKKLELAVKKGKVADIEGFGEQSEESLEKAVKEVKDRKIRHLINYAQSLAEDIIEWMRKEVTVEKVDALGSLRRKTSTVGDIDLAVATKEPKKVLEHFTKYPKASRVLEKGVKSASIILPGNIQVDLLVMEPSGYGSTLQHFTGSKHHNIALRELALKKGLSVSDYGIRKLKNNNKKRQTMSKNSKPGKYKEFKTEEEFYNYLGMDWIPPELREAEGEIEAATKGEIPKLVELSDIKGDLQIHSDFNIETSHDVGESPMEKLVENAKKLSYEYIAFTEHNPSQRGHNHKQITSILKHKKNVIEKLNTSSVKDVKVFNSLEIDILPSGKLPVNEEGLELLDFALVSIHSSFRQSRAETTKRVLSALSHPKVKIFAHPTGRKLNYRQGVELDWEEILEYCLKRDKWLEINADPARLDLPDFLVHEAIKKGVKLTLGTDSHHVDSMKNMGFGVSVARRGWAEKKDIVNTRSLAEIEKMLN